MKNKELPLLIAVSNVLETSAPSELIEALGKAGYEFSVVVLFKDNDKEKMEKIRKIKNIELIELKGGRSLFLFPSNFIKFLRIVNKLKPKMIHSCHNYTDFLSYLTSKFVGTKVIHANRNDFRFYPPLIRVLKWVTLRDSIAVFNTKNNLISAGNLAKRTKFNIVIYNGVPIYEKSNYRRIIKNKRKLNVGFVARLIPQKDVFTALKAFKLLQENSEDEIMLHLAGRGELKKGVLQFIDKNKLKNVTYYGFLLKEDVFSLMSETDVFLLTSRFEGCCNAAIEAMLHENMIVCSDIEPLKSEIVGTEGSYSEAGDYAAVAEILLKLKKNRPIIRTKGKLLKKRAIEKFSMHRMVTDYVNFYREIANEK